MSDLSETIVDSTPPHTKAPVLLHKNPDGTYSRGVWVGSNPVVYTSQGSGSNIGTAGSVSGSVPTGMAYLLSYVSLHLSGLSAAEDLTIKLDAVSGSAFDTLLNTTSMSGLTDTLFYPGYYLLLQGGDAIVVSYKNSNLRSYGLQIVFERVG